MAAVPTLAVALAAGAAGCNQPQKETGPAARSLPPDQIAQMLEPNVLGVSCFYDPFNPWLWNEDRSKVRGIVIGALYLQGPDSKGVFGDGIIRPKMYVAQRDEKGERKWTLLKEWDFDVQKAMPFRSKRLVRPGYGYSLFLSWGDEFDLSGREIRLIVSFERSDGLTVGSSKKDFRVPGTRRS